MTAGSAINFIPVPVTLPLTEIIDRLNRMQPVGLYGYPSMLARLAEERRAGRLDIDVAWVNSTSETLSPSGERRSVTRSTCPWSTTSVPPRG
jgi:phenylacetate-CoA ligase